MWATPFPVRRCIPDGSGLVEVRDLVKISFAAQSCPSNAFARLPCKTAPPIPTAYLYMSKVIRFFHKCARCCRQSLSRSRREARGHYSSTRDISIQKPRRSRLRLFMPAHVTFSAARVELYILRHCTMHSRRRARLPAEQLDVAGNGDEMKAGSEAANQAATDAKLLARRFARCGMRSNSRLALFSLSSSLHPREHAPPLLYSRPPHAGTLYIRLGG